ncbi:lysozyme [Aliivibrio fischeri]|uniref:lysozyme n=1 Tax=Aliivibrio fischeri TaxID=668 RepID=UPI0012DAE6AC|nr:lysozyme [Aliivibrio fischeri]MUJ22563.1 glycoside hydrolase family protein [Aliivibrio fischeri]
MSKIKKVVCSVLAVIGLITGGVTLNDHTKSVGSVIIDGNSFGKLRISSDGLLLIGDAEGCRQDPYSCPAGLKTNGIGNTHTVPKNIVSLEQVAIDWVRNIQDSEQCVTAAESIANKVMSQGQFDAFTSFIFNTGCTRFMRNKNGSQTKIYTHILNGQYAQACKELPRWVYGGGTKLAGLVNRRGLEYARCLEIN